MKTPHLDALRYLCKRTMNVQTHHVATAISFDVEYGSEATTRMRSILQTLERRGMVEADRGRLSNAIFWTVTKAGRRLVLETDGCPRCSGDCSAANPPVIDCPWDAVR